jgi:hypothetical protein
MELKPQDILHLTSTEYNGFFLIVEITPTFMKVRNSTEEHTILIQDGVVDAEIVLVHSAIIPGFAETRGFLPEKKVRIEVDFQPDPLYGIIQTLEKDQIEVLLSDGMTIYIDFEYKGPPSSILSIVLDAGLEVEYEEMDIFVSESQSRFTLDRQLSDLMDRLLTKQTSKHIQEVNQIVQRFKELRHTFSTPDLEPKWNREKKYPWAFPFVSLKRKLYPLDEDNDQWIQRIQGLQEKTESYLSIYKQIVQEFQPFFNEKGEEVKETQLTFINNGKICKTYSKEETKIKNATLIPQVVTIPYSLLHTPSEVIQPSGYLSFSPEYYQYKSSQLPLLQKLPYHSIVPHLTHTDGVKNATIVLPEVQDQVATFDLFSIYHYLQYLGPFDLKKNDLREDDIFRFMYPLERSVQNYRKPNYPSYQPSKLTESLTMEQVSLHATTEAMAFQLDERKFVDKVDTSKPVSPPIVKQYATVKALKGDKGVLFHDKEFDRTDYGEMEAYTTIEEMMRFLIQIKRMLPSSAALYAPHFLNQKRRVVNGEYAKVGDHYYKRVQDDWKLDETCSGPYPCTAEPECEPPCDDFMFKLKQNTLNSMVQEVKIEYYKTSLERTAYLQKKKDLFSREAERMIVLRERQKNMYTDRFVKTAVSHITQSPYTNVLQFVLQKPYQERYRELKQFILQFTRIALKGEDSSWYYCEETDTKLLPLVFERLIEAYETDTYAVQLEELKKQGHLQVQEDSIVTAVGGFFVAPLDTSSSFDDMVRSTVVEDFFLELPRDVHPNTPLIVEILNETSTLAKVNVTKYYNYMIHELVSESTVLVKGIAFVLKIAEILYQTNTEDVIPALLKRQPRFNVILLRFHMEEEVLTRKNILDEMKSISTKYGVQMIQTKTVKVNKSSSWTTFLPPFHVKKHPSFQLMYTLQEHVKKEPPMEATKISSWKGELPRKEEEVPSTYHPMKNIPFTFDAVPPLILPSTPVLLEKIQVKEERKPIEKAFQLLIPPLKRELAKLIAVDFIPPTIPLLYLRTFIQNIGRAYPSFILHTISFQQIPLSLPFLSLQHKQKLTELIKKQIFSDLRTFEPKGLGLDTLLEDPEITDIMDALQRPCTRSEYEYYIFFIFQKYVAYGDRKRTLTLITLFIESFLREHKGIYLTYEEIQRRTLKDRATEANQRRVLFNAMDPEKKFTSSFLEETNLTKKAQLGRSRDYIVERYEGNEFAVTEAIDLPDGEPFQPTEVDPLDLSLVQMARDLDFGTDGNGDNDEEE